jgi:GntR family transcriptional repressor for pyruvate dehydrogenase complex
MRSILVANDTDRPDELGEFDGGAGFGELEARKLSLTDSAYLIVLRRIALGHYGAGDKLPSEQALCEELEVSRPILRRALDRLREDELLVSRRGSGSFVTSKAGSSAPRFAAIETIADLQCSYEFRLAVEPEAARLAAMRHDAEMVERLELAYAALEQAIATRQRYAEADFNFHVAVSQASNNHYYASTMSAMQGHISLGMRIMGRAMASEPSIVRAQHRSILDAIKAGAGDAAKKAMAKHIDYSRDRLFDGRYLDLSLRSGESQV